MPGSIHPFIHLFLKTGFLYAVPELALQITLASEIPLPLPLPPAC